MATTIICVECGAECSECYAEYEDGCICMECDAKCNPLPEDE